MKVRLGDCLTMIKNGATISQKSGASGLPITRIETLSNGEFNRDRMGYADIFDSKEYESYILDDGDLLLSHINSRTFLGRTVIYQKEGDEQIIHGMNLLRLKTDPLKLDNYYAYYLFQTAFFKKNIDNIRKDAINQSSITTTDIQNIILDLPDLTTQKRVAKVLSDIDSKIALNRRINQKFEETARRLYDYWFLQFDFPAPAGSLTADGHPIPEGAPYRSSGGAMSHNATLNRPIPQGWVVKELKDVLDMYQPQTIPMDNLSDNLPYKVYGANGLIGHYGKYNHEESEIAMACRGNSCGVVNRVPRKAWITGNAMVMHMKDERITNEFFALSVPYINIKGVITGSGQPQITRENLNPVKILWPAENILLNFTDEVSPIIEHQLHLIDEIDRLCALRDRLLPLLMNGQVTINE